MPHHDPLPDLNALTLDGLYAHLRTGPFEGLIDRLIGLARDEDTGGAALQGDITAIATDAPNRPATAHLVAREAGVLAGGACAGDVMRAFGAQVSVTHHLADGQPIEEGSRILTLEGPLAHIVTVERTMLNLVCRLTGVATQTARYARAIGDAKARLYDTRKTTPGLRVLEKYAVRCGGGNAHRMGLHDAVLLKDNHIADITPDDLAAFVRSASERARDERPIRFVMCEVDRLDQFDALLTLPTGVVDIVLLDNMTPDTLSEASARRDAHAPTLELEASGGVTLDTIGEIARTGVDRISVGALTHSAMSIDLGLDIEPA